MPNIALLFRHTLWIPLAFLGVYLVTIFFRPLLPIDETRYLGVAWEMFLRHDWLAPLTNNGEPYHHKPPLLFWLINAVWFITEPSRWAATIPPVLMGLVSVYLTIMLAQRLFAQNKNIADRVPYILMGCMPFLLYSSMIMFDITMTCFVLLTLLNMLSFLKTQKWRYVVLMGLTMGLGVLTKGPVAYLYVIFPILLAPLWQDGSIKLTRWYGGCLTALLLSTIPVLLWLVPVLKQSDSHFAFWLVWEQTAGRVTGNFNDAHVRPFVFYLPIAVLLMMPWIFFPQLWKQGRGLRHTIRQDAGLKFILCWIVPTFISFCLISGKQPHYLVPLLPGLAILMTYLLKDLDLKILKRVAAIVYILFVLAHGVGAQTFFKNYDLMPIATYMEEHAERDWAFVGQYHGEMTFLARKTSALDVVVDRSAAQAWLVQHPSGFVIMRYKRGDDVAGFHEILSIPYRGKTLGIFKAETALDKQSFNPQIRSSNPFLYRQAENGDVMGWLLFVKLLRGPQPY